MNPQEAINILDRTVGEVPMTRKDHAIHMQAIQIIRAELEKLKKPKEEQQSNG